MSVETQTEEAFKQNNTSDYYIIFKQYLFEYTPTNSNVER